MFNNEISLNFRKSLKNNGKSKICLAADVDNLTELYKLIDSVGDKICILKIHYDIIKDFCNNLDETIKTLLEYKSKFGFLIWEDSKFGDIGFIMKRKIDNHISKWADLISVHPIGGVKSIEHIDNIGLILIGELSCEGHLINQEYQNNVIKIAENSNNIFGIVCQHKMSNSEHILNITPGISLNTNKDSQGQCYASPSDKSFADIFVVGRAIYQSKDPRKSVEELIIKTKI